MITEAKNPPSHDPTSWSMLDRLARGVVSPLANLRDAIDLTLEQVADWLADARNRRRINNLLMLLNVQAQLLLSEHRLLAAERLLDVINDPKAAPETVRRACSDLLKTNLVDLVELRRGQQWEGESDQSEQETKRRRDGETKWEGETQASGEQKSEGGGQRSEGLTESVVPASCPHSSHGQNARAAGKVAAPPAAGQAAKMPAPPGKGKAAAAAPKGPVASILSHGLAPPASNGLGSIGRDIGGGQSGSMFIASKAMGDSQWAIGNRQ